MVRESWIDSLRGLLIILVVLGHVVGGAGHLGHGAFFAQWYKVIYAFHMPAFFFLAGLLWRPLSETDGKVKAWLAFVGRQFRRLLVPYFIFGICSIFIYVLIQQMGLLRSVPNNGYYSGKTLGSLGQMLLSLAHAGGWPNGQGFVMNSVLWFLPCLFMVKVIYAALGGGRWGWKADVGLAVMGLAVYWGTLRMTLPWGLHRVSNYLVFLLAGKSFAWFTSGVTVRKSLWGWVGGLLFAGLIGLCLMLPDLGVPYWGARYWLLVFGSAAVLGCVAACALAKALDAPWLARLGVASLGIMLIHKFVVFGLQYGVPVVRQQFAGGLTRAIGASLVVTVVSVVCSYGATVLIRRKAPWSLGECRRK